MIKLLIRIWKYWKAFADWVLRTIFQAILLVFYFTILIPFALFFRFSDKETFLSGWKPASASSSSEMY